MKALVCEMCNSNQIRKENGVFVCQNCGTQYSIEEAKKLLVEIEGSVKIDNSDEVTKLYQAARNALRASDYSTALSDYEMLTRMDPNNWEPVFYSILLKSFGIRNGEIESAALRIANGLPQVFDMVNKINDSDEKKTVVKEIVDQSYVVADHLIKCSHAFRNAVTGGGAGIVATAVISPVVGIGNMAGRYADDRKRCVVIVSIMSSCGELIERKFDMKDDYYRNLCVLCWKIVRQFNRECAEENKIDGTPLFAFTYIQEINNKLRLLESTQQLSQSGISDETMDRILKIQKETLALKTQLENLQAKQGISIVIIVFAVMLVGIGFLALLNAGHNGGVEAFGTISIVVGSIGIIVGIIRLLTVYLGKTNITSLKNDIKQNEYIMETLKR